MKELQVGQKVWSIELGDCEVYKIYNDSKYPIRCNNISGKTDSYTIDGKRHIADNGKSLFESNPFERSVDTTETIEPKLVRQQNDGWVENKAELINALVNISIVKCDSHSEISEIALKKLHKLLESI